ASASRGFRTAPPNPPEWRSRAGPSTSTSRSTSPRSPTQTEGWPRSRMAASRGVLRLAEPLEVARADLLLPLHDQLEVEGQLAAGAQMGFDRLEVHPHHALVVGGSATAELLPQA